MVYWNPDLVIVYSPTGYFRGADVIGKTEFAVSRKGGNFEWKGYGLKLAVPSNCLPPAVETDKFTVTASLSGQFEIPENYELISPIFWIAAPDNLSKPVLVEIQHCLADTSDDTADPSDLYFITAKCTQESLPYKFKPIGGIFTRTSSYGSIEVSHFSGMGIASKRKCQSAYCAQVYYNNKSRHEWRVYFVITRNLDAVLTVSHVITLCMVAVINIFLCISVCEPAVQPLGQGRSPHNTLPE